MPRCDRVEFLPRPLRYRRGDGGWIPIRGDLFSRWPLRPGGEWRSRWRGRAPRGGGRLARKDRGRLAGRFRGRIAEGSRPPGGFFRFSWWWRRWIRKVG